MMLANNTLLLLGRLVVEQFEGVEAALLGCEFERVDQLAYRLADVLPLNWAEDQAKHQEEVANYIDQLEQKDIEIEGLEDEKRDDYAADLKDLLEEVRRAEIDISSAAGEIESRIAGLEQSLEERISQLTRRVR